MVWADFVAEIVAKDFTGGVEPNASRYGGVPDMYAISNIAASSPAISELSDKACFATLGVADLAFSALFISEPNILVLDWDLGVSRTVEVRWQEMQQIFKEASYQPHKISQHPKLQENASSEPYDYEYWERMCMALIEHYRRKSDPRSDLLLKELNKKYIEHKQAFKRLEYLSRGEKYEDNEINRESMEEFSVGNQQRMLGENFYDEMRELFFNFLDPEILKLAAGKNYCYININLLDIKSVEMFAAVLQTFNLYITRFNLADMLDEIATNPSKIRSLIACLNKLTDPKILASNVNDFSLCIPFPEMIKGLTVLLLQAQLIDENPRVGGVSVGKIFDKNYLTEFIKYSIFTTDKNTFTALGDL